MSVDVGSVTQKVPHHQVIVGRRGDLKSCLHTQTRSRVTDVSSTNTETDCTCPLCSFKSSMPQLAILDASTYARARLP